MAKRDKAMSERELTAQLDGQISDAVSYSGSELASRREKALKYFDGDVSDDIPTVIGHSSVVSQDVADTMGWILPGLMRVFLSGTHIGVFEPDGEDGEQKAKDATDYINYRLIRQNGGRKVLRSAMFDGLLSGNGILKHWWEKKPEYKTTSYSGLSDDQYTMLVSADEVEIVEHTATEGEPAVDPMTGAEMPGPVLHDVKIKTVVRKGRLRVKALPAEDFRISRNATALNEEEYGGFCSHRSIVTRSELRTMYPDKREIIDGLPIYSHAADDSGEKDAREPLRNNGPGMTDDASDPIEIEECYLHVDFDGDGVAELRQVVIAAEAGENQLLDNVEWGDDLPFTDLVPDPVPHRWRGRSIFDEVGEVQKVKTATLRGVQNSMYKTLEPNRAADASRIANKDAMLDLKAGDIIWTDGDPNTIIRDLTIPFVGREAMVLLEYWDTIAERRTGVGNQSAGLDKDTLQTEQTATKTNAMQSASYAKQEDYAWNIAEGVERLFKCMLRLYVKNQTWAESFPRKSKFVRVDPREWSTDMDCSVNVGLGSGSRERDLQMLSGIKQSQELILSQMGPSNPLVPLDKYANTLRKMVEVSGVKNPDSYFNELTPEIMQQMAAAAGQPKPDPKMMEAQAKLQIEQQKAQTDAQLAQQRAGAELQLSRDKAAAQLEADRESANLKLQMLREETAARMQLAREEALMKAQLRREEMQLEAELTQEVNRMNAAGAATRPMDTNLERNP
jgi:hypothetical protein